MHGDCPGCDECMKKARIEVLGYAVQLVCRYSGNGLLFRRYHLHTAALLGIFHKSSSGPLTYLKHIPTMCRCPQAKHVCHYLGGFVSSLEPPRSSDTCGVTLAAMTAGDVAECADLFLAAHGMDSGWDRRPEITESLKSGVPFAM